MKRTLLALTTAALLASSSASAGLILTGVIDGPRSGGLPKAVEIYATSNIADLSSYSVEYWFNANGSPSVTVSLSGSASAGDFIHIASEGPNFTAYFSFDADLTTGGSINGDDSIVLKDGATTVDVYGAPGTDGTGEDWEYLDSYAYRVNGTSADGTFTLSNWNIAGPNFLDSQGSSGVNGTDGKTVPFGSFVPEPTSLALLGLGGLLIARRRRG